jgi:hypothetical protein
MNKQLSVKELVENVGYLDNASFEDFYEKIQSIRLLKLPVQLAEEDIKWIEKIQFAVPRQKQMRFDYLIAKRDSRTITDTQFQELLILTTEIERIDLLRLKRMAKFADQKNISLEMVAHLVQTMSSQHG